MMIRVEGRMVGTHGRRFTLNHLAASRHFAKKCEEIEQKPESRELGAWFDNFSHYFVGSIILAAASIEALYTEIIIDCGLDPNLAKKRSSLKDRLKLLNKETGKCVVDFGQRPAQFLGAIIELRDCLIHPEPALDVSLTKHIDAIARVENINSTMFQSKFFQGENSLLRYFTYKTADWVSSTSQGIIVNAFEHIGQEKKAQRAKEL